MDLITTKMQLNDVREDILATRPKLAASLKAAGMDGDDVPYIRKGIVPSDMEFNKGERSVIATISTLAVDRDGEVVLPEGMDNTHFKLNPVVTFGHDYTKLPLGSAKWVDPYPAVNPVEIRAKTIYPTAKANPFSEQVLQYQREGFPLAKSIGFIPVKSVTPEDKNWNESLKNWRERRTESFEMKGIKVADRPKEDDPKRIYTEWILLEYSDVPIPSNPEAVNIMVSKGLLSADSASLYLPGEEVVEDDEVADIKNAVDLAVESGQIAEDSPGITRMDDVPPTALDAITDDMWQRMYDITGQDIKAHLIETEMIIPTVDPDKATQIPTLEKEGRRFSKQTLKALDGVRAAATASSEANQAVIEALDILIDLPETDETDVDIDAKEIDIEDITPEQAAYLLEEDAKEKQAAADAKKLTAAEEVLVRLGGSV